MNDYVALYKELAKAIIKTENTIANDSAAIVKELVRVIKKSGYQLNPESQQLLTQYYEQVRATMSASIAAAAAIGSGQSMQSPIVQQLSAEAFSQVWPDGLTLSARLWNWKNTTRQAVIKTLSDGIIAGKNVDALVMSMQRAIELSTGKRFAIVNEHIDDWMKELYESSSMLIHDAVSKKDWQQVVNQSRDIIEGLKETGSRHAAERAFSQIMKAVKQGDEALLDSSVKWWSYDKQLYNLKRIARTEMANAGHRAVIASTVSDETIIGYQWRLSSSHPVTDICDYYASVDMGFGRGVFSKDTVPRAKAHPHCMCLLIPRVTPLNSKGSKTYAQWLDGLSRDKLHDMMPAWGFELVKNGVSPAKLLASDGVSWITKDESLKKLDLRHFSS